LATISYFDKHSHRVYAAKLCYVIVGDSDKTTSIMTLFCTWRLFQCRRIQHFFPK